MQNFFNSFIEYVIRSTSLRPDYYYRNLGAELIDFVKRYKNFNI
jgi:hypothetical protein